MYPVRRRQLMTAALEVIGRQGLEQATVVNIAQEAGLSPGIIRHYFGSKDELLEATVRHFQKRLKLAVQTRCRAVDGPLAKVFAIIEGNFAAEQIEPQAVSAWLAFWSRSSSWPPNLVRLRRVHIARLRRNLSFWLQQIVPRARARRIATGLTAFIDGLWVALALDDDLSAEEACGLAREYVTGMLGEIKTASCEPVISR